LRASECLWERVASILAGATMVGLVLILAVVMAVNLVILQADLF
jgi:hypothetical protein